MKQRILIAAMATLIAVCALSPQAFAADEGKMGLLKGV